jgi:thioredoxin-related protein
MKKIVLVLFALFLCTKISYSNDLKFETGTFQEVLAKAKAENKLLMIDFVTDWCIWCIHTDIKVYTNSEIIDFASQNQINWKVDAEKGEGIELAKKYGVVGYPTILFVDGDGNEVDRIYGYYPAKDFLETIKNYSNRVKTLPSLQAAVKESPNDVAANYMLAEKLLNVGKSDEAGKYLEFVIKNDAGNASGYYEDALFQTAYGKNDVAAITEIINKYPESNITKDAYIFLFNDANAKGNQEDINKYMEILKTNYSTDEMVNFYIGQYYLGKASKISKDEKATTEMYKEALIDADASFPYLQGGVFEAGPSYVKSVIYYKMGDYTVADEFIDKSLAIWGTRKSYVEQKQKIQEKLNPPQSK